MKNRIITALIVCAALAAVTSVAVAQENGPITLQSLSDQLTTLTSRVVALESIWEGPGVWENPDKEFEVADDQCIVGLSEKMQHESTLKYLDKYDDVPYRIEIDQVIIDPTSNSISLVFRDWRDSRHVVEKWNGCEFVGSSDWTKR